MLLEALVYLPLGLGKVLLDLHTDGLIDVLAPGSLSNDPENKSRNNSISKSLNL